MKIVFLDELTLGSSIDLSRLSKLGEYTGYATTDYGQIIERASQADIIITNKVKLDKAVLRQLPQLKLICEAATGVDNIDVEFAKSLGVEVKNVKGYSTASVAQHTFSMLFYLLNNMEYYKEYTNNGEWHRSEVFSHFKSFKEIKSKTWGVIGLGAIGESVASIASAFGAKVIYYSTSGENKNNAYPSVPLDELLSTSDFISIHCPLNEKTRNLVGLSELEKLKSGSILLNLGRGGIINEDSIVSFLSREEVGPQIALDVLSKEPIDGESVLNKVLGHKNLFITPHVAWASEEARRTLVEKICLNISNFKI